MVGSAERVLQKPNARIIANLWIITIFLRDLPYFRWLNHAAVRGTITFYITTYIRFSFRVYSLDFGKSMHLFNIHLIRTIYCHDHYFDGAMRRIKK